MAGVAALAAIVCAVAMVWAQSAPITVTLAGQSMIRSDMRATAPGEVPVIQELAQRRCGFHESGICRGGEGRNDSRGPRIPDAAGSAGRAEDVRLQPGGASGNHAFDLKATGIPNTIREADARKIVHAGTGNNLAEAAAPGYLHTAKGTIALVASASGLITPGGSATADRPGVNELRVEAGGKENEATDSAIGPVRPRTRRIRKMRSVFCNSIRDARQHADVVIVYQHNHVFSNHSFSTIFTEGMAERLAPNEWLQKWTHAEIDAGADIVVMHGAPLLHGVEIYRGRPIFYDLGNLIYNAPPTLTYIDEPMAGRAWSPTWNSTGKAMPTGGEA